MNKQVNKYLVLPLILMSKTTSPQDDYVRDSVVIMWEACRLTVSLIISYVRLASNFTKDRPTQFYQDLDVKIYNFIMIAVASHSMVHNGISLDASFMTLCTNVGIASLSGRPGASD